MASELPAQREFNLTRWGSSLREQMLDLAYSLGGPLFLAAFRGRRGPNRLGRFLAKMLRPRFWMGLR